MEIRSAKPVMPGAIQIRALVAHEDQTLRLPIIQTLGAHGYEVEEIRRGTTLVDRVRRDSFDLVLLDLKMPGPREGIENCRLVRELSPDSGIMVVTGTRQAEGESSENKVRILEAGADDYVTAPFEPRELHARLRAILRRIRSPKTSGRVLKVADLEIDLDRRTVRQNQRSIHVTRREFDLLALMMQRAGTPIPHVQLLRSVWGPDYGNELEYLRAYIRLLRRKIEANPSKPVYIVTETGVGYRFQDPIGL